MKDIEVWKNIDGYGGKYKISNVGNVFSVVKSKLLIPIQSKSGYLLVRLHANKKGKNFRVHRLVAMHFLINPHNKPQVNHINEDKSDNRVENLEWCTASENMKHSFEIGLREKARSVSRVTVSKAHEANKKKVAQYKLNGELIRIFDSASDAYRYLQKKSISGDIAACCKGKSKTAYGYKWTYVDSSRDAL